ncbi:MAG: hypothetical protein PHP03_01695 [Candidatus Pacebacteria bacterium]|nr:hypothetical protein [Candidatus Paceibacterota bacterium]
MNKKAFISILFTVIFIFGVVTPYFNLAFLPAGMARAEEQKSADIYFFWSIGCPFCAKEKVFLKEMEQKYPGIKIHDFEISQNQENIELLKGISALTKIEISRVPITIIGQTYFDGFYEYLKPNPIEMKIQACVKDGCPDKLGETIKLIKEQNSSLPTADNGQTATSTLLASQKIKVPFFGEIAIADLSLPVLSVVIGSLDGFNPCAMWVLLFLISLLLGEHDKKKRWALGSAFIVASAVVYFIFMAAWLNLIIFLGMIAWIRILIGLVALVGGGYNLKKFFTVKTNTCDVAGEEKKQSIADKLKAIIKKQNFLLALFGIIILAFSINLVEAICSAGLPVVFTQVLANSHLPAWQNYIYMLIYLFFFMLDDMVVFVIAMVTLQLSGIESKYARYSHLIGGILMLIIGLLLIFKPAWLMFG